MKWILPNAKQLQHAQFYLFISGLKIIGHGNRNNNLESSCIFHQEWLVYYEYANYFTSFDLSWPSLEEISVDDQDRPEYVR
jgi:hypothetical protein